ncbi:hypothetical protein K435DRAFT_81276 [Dendrothele bispora CBS 962.96]|uniref:Uncharacterized protein n=1 Tax=Dendrothele bispora (strain CBS 962.96) TaxID=1314807 RepID=A0A4S8M3V1_DENBC|nr:hypothetical protein K435DRAFT_81276 [Dendrothele bispora CBS 962.96]
MAVKAVVQPGITVLAPLSPLRLLLVLPPVLPPVMVVAMLKTAVKQAQEPMPIPEVSLRRQIKTLVIQLLPVPSLLLLSLQPLPALLVKEPTLEMAARLVNLVMAVIPLLATILERFLLLSVTTTILMDKTRDPLLIPNLQSLSLTRPRVFLE